MPAVMPVSVVSCPMPSRDTSAAASSNETSVKTAIDEAGSEGEDAPDPLAGDAALRVGAVGVVASGVGGNDLVALHAPFGLNADALRLAAHLQFLDAGAIVFDHRQLDL